ncbi:unnamed protein product [Porites lobata]|uniref:Uncharacterized protein n=1 Tax=Porites lobata TaxID=104759 RepID=A0ABN8N3K5_9CNID|nr:unnamed protein product [Porites lobata]
MDVSVEVSANSNSVWEYDSGESDLELTSHPLCGHRKNTKEAEEGVDEARHYYLEKIFFSSFFCMFCKKGHKDTAKQSIREDQSAEETGKIGILMRNLVGKKELRNKTLMAWHNKRSLQREREKGRKEELLPKFMILSIQRCNIK